MNRPNAAEDSTRSGVCVVSQPIGETGDSAPRTLLDILAANTSVSLMAAAVPSDSPIRDDYEIVDLVGKTVGDSVISDALGFLFMQLRMCREITVRDEAVVLFFGTTTYLLPILWARLLSKTVVLEPRGDVPHRLRVTWEEHLPSAVAGLLAGALSLLEHLGYLIAHAIVAYNPSMAADLGLDRYEHKLHPNGARYVDTEQFGVRTPFESREMTVGYIGRFEEGKGVRALAGAVHKLPDDVTVRFIGDGPLRGWLEDELADEIRAGSVELTGWVDHDEIPDQLNRLRLLVLPSESEGLPTIMLESLACGTPVYATPVSGIRDVLEEGITGFLLDSRDPDTVAEDVTDILQDNDLATISKNGRELIEAEYSYEAAVRRYRKILIAIGHPPGDG